MLKNKKSTLKFLSYGTAFSFLSFLSFNALFPAIPSNAVSSASTVADLELEIEPTIEVAIDTETLNLTYNGETDVLPTSEGITATGDINVYVTTNGLSGYTLSLYAQNATNEMKNINSAVSTSIAATDGGVSDLANNTWGFQYNGSDWTAVSDDATNPSVLVSSNSANTTLCNNLSGLSGNTESLEQCVTNGSASKATVTFGANITDTLPAGRYTNDVVFSAIAKSPSAKHAYSITYDKNNASAEGSTTGTTALYPGTATLSDGTGLTLEGMRIAGWAFTAEATTVAEVGSSNTPLTAGATDIDTADLIAAAQAAGQDVSEEKSGKITLYAVWESTADLSTITKMQEMTTDICNGSDINYYKTLSDTRDNKTYAVKKMKDGNCWMAQNLRLTDSKTLTPSDSDVSENWTFSPTSSWCTQDTQSCIDVTRVYNGTSGWSDNTYYNYYSATASTGGYTTTSQIIPNSICPKGWRLPSREDYTNLYTSLGSDISVFTGSYTSGDNAGFSRSHGYVWSGYPYIYSSNSEEYYWTSTNSSSSVAYKIDVTSSVNTGGQIKIAGYSVRCIAR